MPLELETFDPNTVDELWQAIVDELKELGSKWWATNREDVSGHVRALAEASLQTRVALAQGRIKADQADRIMHMQEVAFTTTVHFTKYMTFVLAQKVLDSTFSIVGWAIYNRTGINLFPQIVKP